MTWRAKTWLADVVTVPAPSAADLPGSQQLSNLVAGVEYLALLVLVAAMAWFAVEWAVASHTNNAYQMQSGKVGFMRAAGGAIVIRIAIGIAG